MVADKPGTVRLRQSLAMLAGALALQLLVGGGTLRFIWTPLLLGLTYLVVAGLGGRDGGHWPTACVLTGWGLSVVYVGEVRPQDVDLAGAYLVGAGAGVATGALLARAGFAISDLGLGLTVVGGGLALALSPKWPAVLDEARTYALALGVVGLVNLILAVTAAPARAQAGD